MADFRRGDTANWDAEQVRRSERSRQQPARTQQDRSDHSQPARRKRRRRRRINPILYLLCVLLVSALLAGVGWLLASDLCAFNKDYIQTTVEVTADDTVSTVADKLQDAGLIEYKWFFRLFASVAKAEEKIGMGTYELNTEMDYRALIVSMRSGSGNMSTNTVRVTIPEGYTVDQIIRLLAKNGVNTEEQLLDAAQNHHFDYDFIDNNSKDAGRLEGYLFPDTYDFYVNGSAAVALDRLLSEFARKIDGELLDAAEARGYNLKKIVTIASLIEKETDGTDQGNIASVIYNRLEGSGDKAGTYGLLQIDASLLYALPDHEGAITSADLQTDSPYNLSKYAGLPPTPIANPGLASLMAALEPEETDYYYYALGTDGRHHFFTNYADHSNFVNSSQYGG
ncbi:MAG: endolytic transglycosylase MltG [Oscillibacter sp.]|nr:endolytic transglycosylase MltG [Oscillibacter sp.]